LLTGREWLDQYLLPLSQTDLLADGLRPHSMVIAVSRQDFLKHDSPVDEDRDDSPFRILVSDQSGRDSEATADVVIDATGVYRTPNWMGPGGIPALGERQARNHIRYDLPDVIGTDRERYANQRVLVVGAGFSAATSIAALVELAKSAPDTRTTWVTRSQAIDGATGPIAEIENDPLAERARLARTANRAATGDEGSVAYWPGTMVKSVQWLDAERHFSVEFQGQHAARAEFDEIIGNVGYHPDNTLYAELQVHECYA
jgi:thioredoxin reductase